jgi:glycosyltransferase involved in cell wall biosynthesis
MVMPHKPKITVITVVLNGEADIARTIGSVLCQNFKNFEYLVLDGGSSDATLSIARSFMDPRIQVHSIKDSGIYDAMNQGYALASGETILYMNCGDILFDEYSLSNAFSELPNEGVFVALLSWLRDEKHSKIPLLCHPNLKSMIFNHQAIIYSRSLHHYKGPYCSIRGFTTADYYFFSLVLKDELVKKVIINQTFCIIDARGVSSGIQTYSQKICIDFLFGRTNRFHLALILLLHPIYNFFKRLYRFIVGRYLG